MRSPIIRKAGVITACLIAFCSNATSATVISDGVELRSPYTSEVPGNYQLTVVQALNRDYTSIWFTAVNDTLRHRTTLGMTTFNVDESADLYLASLGDEFSSATIQANQFTAWDSALIYSGKQPTLHVALPLSDFYLGINTGRANSIEDWSQTRSVFGWAHFQNTTSGIVLLESKMAYGAGGIIIGSANVISAVPEVDSGSMALLGFMVLGALKGLNGRRKHPSLHEKA